MLFRLKISIFRHIPLAGEPEWFINPFAEFSHIGGAEVIGIKNKIIYANNYMLIS
jgi:hypothetical protein